MRGKKTEPDLRIIICSKTKLFLLLAAPAVSGKLRLLPLPAEVQN